MLEMACLNVASEVANVISFGSFFHSVIVLGYKEYL
jgi:hypothetical protein